MAQIQAGAQVDEYQAPGRVLLPQEQWKNGSRHTLVLQRICLAPINYILQETDDGDPKNALFFNNSGSILNRMQVFITAPGRYHWSTQDLIPTAFTPAPSQPSMEYTAEPLASSLFGVSRWDFDFEAPFWLPRRARIQFDLSGWGMPTGADALPESVFYAVSFNELPMEGYAARLPGTCRLNQRQLMSPAATNTQFPGGPMPFAADGFGAISPGTQFANSMWFHQFLANNWDGQEPTRGVTHSEYSGFGVLIDQIDYDTGLQAIGNLLGEPVTPLANRVGCRVRTTNGGSNEWWWRPGAPLSLVTPTIGTALVHELEKPIVLAPGDALTVEVQAPPLDLDVTQNYQLGVSMLGYARIES